MYVTRESSTRTPGATVYRASGVSLPIQWDSALLGYLRVWLAWACIASPFVLFWGEHLDFSRSEWSITIGLLIAWIAVLVIPGFVLRAGSDRRNALALATGISVEPRRLGAVQRAGYRNSLAYDLESAQVDATDPARFAESSANIEPHWLPKLYAYASYAAADDSEWNATVEALWKRMGST
jgi:hypothetical protein